MQNSIEEKLNTLAQAIYDKKGFNILAIDLRGISSLTDALLIAEGSVDRHVQTLAKIVADKAEEIGLKAFHIDGQEMGDWIVVDCGEIMIHLFIPDMRDKYRLEQVWQEGKIVDLDVKIKSEEQP